MSREVELRAIVSRSIFNDLTSKFGSVSRVERRCFVDYSTFIEGIGERQRDVRVRMTNGNPEIIVKIGAFGGEEREEHALPFAANDLGEALALMASLGYRKGVAGGRRIHRASLNSLEIALQEVLDFREPSSVCEYFVEVEYVGEDIDDVDPASRIRHFLALYELEECSPKQWYDYIKYLNDNYNGVYEHGITSITVIEQLGR